MNILVVGGGGREHALVWALAKSSRIQKIYCAPGNGGVTELAECVNIKATDLPALVAFARDTPVDFVLVAPDDPLALGLVDALEEAGIPAFGPRKNAAILESSKIFSKELMAKYRIPTAKYRSFDDMDAALSYIRLEGAPIVVKADGLALGKGVVVATDLQMAQDAVRAMMADKKFGASGARVVIEECMQGPEVTVLAFTDGKAICPMPASQDHKRAFDGDAGPNTGGMGAFCPTPTYTPEIAQICMEQIFRPTVDAMNREGRTFKGTLYFGLMLTASGPKVVEYNARFGDPETQPILSLLETDLMDILEAVYEERLGELEIKWRDASACCVVMASGGYPGSYTSGYEICGLDTVPADITVFHAGTKRDGAACRTAGGRVLGVTATGETLDAAIRRAYEGVAKISFQDAYYRSDIGKK